MTHDLFSTLYRLRHCWRVPSTAASLPVPAQRPAIIAVRDALGKGEVLSAEHHFQALLALPAAELERTVIKDSAVLMHDLECWHGSETLGLLHEWALQCPMSVWPRVLELMYWQARLVELRFYQAQSGRALPEDVWHDVSILMSLIHQHAFALLGKSALDWRIAQLLLSVELTLNAPEWAEAWCDGLTASLPDQALLVDYASPQLLNMGLEKAWWPDLPHQRPALLQVDEDDLPAQGLRLSSRWLYVGLKASPYGYSCLQQTAVSHLLWLPETPAGLQKTLVALAQTLSLEAEDINAINSLFWQEDIYALIRQDSPQHLIAERIHDYLHHRPLSPAVRSTLICRLMDSWDNREPSSFKCVTQARVQWHRYRCAQQLLKQPAEALTEQQLIRLVKLWVAHGKKAVWCRPLIEAKRHDSALAAVLYGIMCDNGWAGLQRSPLIAKAWYEYAVTLAPPEGTKGFGVADAMSEPFSRALLLLSEEEGREEEFWHVLCFAAEAGYSDAEYRRGLFMSIGPESFCIEDAEKWLMKSLRDGQIDTFVAHYHLGLLYAGRINGVDMEKITSVLSKPFSEHAMYHFMAYLQLFFDQAEAPWREEDYQQIERAMFQAVDVLCTSPEVHSLYLQPLHRMLIRFRDEVRLTAGFTMLAYLYGREDSPIPHFDMAVRMIEGIRQLFPSIESVKSVHGLLRQQSDSLRRRFDQIAATAMADELPGCTTITPPTPPNPFD